jgi:hypothetical protein
MTSMFIPCKLMKSRFHMDIIAKSWPMKFVMGPLAGVMSMKPIQPVITLYNDISPYWVQCVHINKMKMFPNIEN